MVQAPQGQLSRLDVSVEQNGKSYPVFSLDRPTQATTRQDAADRFYVDAADRQAGDSRPAGGPRAHRRACRAAGDARTPPGRIRNDARRPGQARAAAGVGALDISLRQSRRRRVRRLSRDAGGRRVGRARRRPHVSRLSRHRGRHQERPRRARRVLRTVVRPGREDADQRLRTRSRGQRRRRGPRAHAVLQTVFAQHDPDRQLGRARRAADRREHAGDEAVDRARRPGRRPSSASTATCGGATPRPSPSSPGRPRRR